MKLGKTKWLAVSAGVAIMLLLTAEVRANYGTPIFFIGALHLLYGNAFIGLFEGLLLNFLFKVKRAWRCIGLMILANYTSTIAGQASLGGLERVLTSFFGLHLIYDLGLFLVICVIAAYLITLIIEWPFCLAAMWAKPRRIASSIRATLLVQGASYVLLFATYWFSSGADLLRMNRDPSLLASAGTNAVVFFVADDNSVHRVNLDGSDDRRLSEPDDKPFGLYLAELENQPVYRLKSRYSNSPKVFAEIPADGFPPQCDRDFTDFRHKGSMGALNFTPPENRVWDVRACLDRINVQNLQTHEMYFIRHDTPFTIMLSGGVSVRNVTVLPDGKVVFEVSPCILLLEPSSRRIAVIAQGHSPVAVPRAILDATPTTSPASMPTE